MNLAQIVINKEKKKRINLQIGLHLFETPSGKMVFVNNSSGKRHRLSKQLYFIFILVSFY